MVAKLDPTKAKRPETSEPTFFQPSIVVSDVAKATPELHVEAIGDADERSSAIIKEVPVEASDEGPQAGQDDEQDDITFSLIASNDLAPQASRGLRRYDLRRDAEQGEVRHSLIDSEQEEPDALSSNRLSVAHDAFAQGIGSLIRRVRPLPAQIRGGMLLLLEQLTLVLAWLIAHSVRLTRFGWLKALQAGQSCWLALRDGYRALQARVKTAWPNVISHALKALRSCAAFGKGLASQAQVRSASAKSGLLSLYQKLGTFLQRTQESAKVPIADKRATLTKTSPGLLERGKTWSALSVPFERLTAKLSSLRQSCVGPITTLVTTIKGHGLVAVGIAAASVAIAVLTLGYTQVAPSAEASLTFPIPERPPSVEPSGADAIVDESANAIESIISYIADQPQVFEREALSSSNPILATVAAMDGFDEFVRAANTVDLGQLLEPGEAYTIFLPNDGAFARLGRDEIERLFEPTGHERLLSLLSHHIVPERITLENLKRSADLPVSLAGRDLQIDKSGDVRIGNANIVDTNLEAANSILHVIDSVLVFPEL